MKPDSIIILSVIVQNMRILIRNHLGLSVSKNSPDRCNEIIRYRNALNEDSIDTQTDHDQESLKSSIDASIAVVPEISSDYVNVFFNMKLKET